MSFSVLLKLILAAAASFGLSAVAAHLGHKAPAPPVTPPISRRPAPPPPPPAASADDATIGAVSIGASMAAGDPGTWSVEVVNAGTSTWDDTFRLGVVNDLAGDGCRFIETTGAEPNRVHLTAGATVAPGGRFTFSFAVKAPAARRAYSVGLRMVHEGVRWFGQTATQTVTVTAPTAPAGMMLVIDDPLRGSTKGQLKGGSLTPDGYRIDNPDDHITYEVTTIPEGAAELSVKGLPAGIPAGATDDAELYIMYDGDFSPDPEVDYIGFRNNPYKYLLRKRSDDVCKVVLNSPGYASEDTSGKLSWDPNTTYRFRIEWGQGSSRLYRDGTLVKTVSPGGAWTPHKHRIRIGTGGANRGWPGTVTSDLKVWAGSGSTPPPVSVPAGPGPHVVRDANYPARLMTTNGQPFFWVGKTAFSLSAQPRWQEFVNEAAQNGVNVLRILVAAAPGAFNMPQNMFPMTPGGGYDQALFQRLDNVVAYAGTKGMACELVLFECGFAGNLADPQNYNAEKKQYVQFVVSRYKNTPNVIWEVANEYTHGSCGPIPYNGLPDSFVQAVAADVKALDPDHVLGLSDQGSSSPAPAALATADFDLLNYHLPRSTSFWQEPWNVFRATLNACGGRVQINDEPIGSDVVANPGKRSADPAAHRANAWVTAVAQGYYTFHCELGLTAAPGPQPGQECLKAFHDFFDSVGMRGMNAATDLVRGSGAAETYSCRRGDEESVVYLKGGDLSKTLDVRLGGANYDVRVVDPATNNTLSQTTIQGGNQSVSLSGASGDVAVHFKLK